MSDHIPGEPAAIEWGPDGQPVSTLFDDVYFSRVDGLAETRHVFLQHNRLSGRFAALAAGSRFVIGETGFGTGLNFLAAWRLWQQQAPDDAELHYLSVEKYPLDRCQLQRALALWPELDPLARELAVAWPVFVGTGFHHLILAGSRVRLTLIIDDAVAGLEQLRSSDHPLFRERGPRVDAWFLDGFAPAKNPDMWRPELFEVIGHLSGTGTTAATFSAAGLVRRGLEAAGFTVEKVAGFGRKREMIRARRHAENSSASTVAHTPARGNSPWEIPWHISATPRHTPTRRALIIGTGLAGCHSARALAERGWQVTLLEKGEQIAPEASGNRQGVLYGRLSPRDEPQGQFNLAALQYALRHYQGFWQQPSAAGAACGVLQLLGERELTALEPRFGRAAPLVERVDARQASQLAGVALPSGGLYFPEAGWLAPRQVCHWLLDHPHIDVACGAAVAELTAGAGGWQARDSTGVVLAEAPVVVIANAHSARQLAQTSHLPLKAIRGQVSHLPASGASAELRCVLCGDGYLAPAHEGQHCAGATFNLGDETEEPRLEDHRSNLEMLAGFGQQVSGWFAGLPPESLAGRVAFRCATPDYLPLVGPAPVAEDYMRDYAALGRNARSDIPLAGAHYPGLHVNLGHGSRGLAYTPLAAQLLAAYITGELPPLPRRLLRALSPARFIIRDLIRGRNPEAAAPLPPRSGQPRPG